MKNISKLVVAAMLTAMLSSCAALRDAFIYATEIAHPEWTNDVLVVTNAAPVPVPEPTPAPQPPVVSQPPASNPFEGRRIVYKKIASDILSWKETATLKTATVKGDHLRTSGTFPKWPCVSMGDASIQGCFALAVEQPDGSIVIGTWDWDRCGHQTNKTIDNLLHGSEHAFFNLRSGARVWWFITAMSRDNKRTVKERSNFYASTWP